MKSRYATHRAFSLTELLAVILIVFLLAALGIAALVGIQNQIERGKARGLLSSIESGLVRYQGDFGNFPINESSSSNPMTRDAEGLAGAAVLYTHLSGDFDGDGEADKDIDVYMPMMEAQYNSTIRGRLVIENPYPLIEGRFLLIDNFGAPVRYLGNKPGGTKYHTRHPNYDLWFILGTDPGRAAEAEIRAKYISN